LEHILRNTILALLEYPDSTMLGILRMLVNEDYRRDVVDHVTDPVVKDFWINEFERYDQKFRTEAVAPIQNKVGQFLSSSTIRNILGQPKSTIDITDIMDKKKILLMSLAKGKIGEDNTALLGAMLITKIQISAMMRASIPEKDRIDFYLYVDEFQNFATESFAIILSEARKYHLNLIMANQYITQMSEEVRDAVFGNVGTLICFRVGASDTAILAKEYMPVFEETDLINLDKYHVYVKMSIDGVTTIPFSAITLPPLTDATGNKDKAIELSRQKFGRSRETVEAEIRGQNVSAVEKLMAEQTNEAPKEAASTSKPSEVVPNIIPKAPQETPQETPQAQPAKEMPVGFQEVTDVGGEKFYILYRESESKAENQEPKDKEVTIETEQKGDVETNKSEAKAKNETNKDKSEERRVKEIRKHIDNIMGKKKDENGHTIIKEGETHEIKREEDKKEE
jgi:hypothetical protein